MPDANMAQTDRKKRGAYRQPRKLISWDSKGIETFQSIQITDPS